MIAAGQKWLDKRSGDRSRRIVEVDHVDPPHVCARSWYETQTAGGWVRSTRPRPSRCQISGFIARHTRIKDGA